MDAISLLTDRQLEIVQLAAEGLSDQEVADRLGLSIYTVQTHWKNIRESFDAKHRSAIIAQVLKQKQRQKSEGLSEQNQLLLIQSIENQKLLAELEATNLKLAEALAENQRLLSSQMSVTAKLVNTKSAELENLRQLSNLLGIQQVVVHEGEYGASWRKTYMSESVNAFGYTSEQWTEAEITIYDIMRPEDTARALRNLENLDGKRERCIIIYKALTADQKDILLIDFITMQPFDDHGVGRYQAFTFEITEWIELLKEAIANGMPE